MRMMMVCVCGLSLLAALPVSVQAQQKKVDPSGTWRWDLEMNDNTIKNVLQLQKQADGKLTGTLQANDRELPVEEGKVEGETVSFTVTLKMNQTVKVHFEGKLTGDALTGDITAKSDEGEREFKWEAKRAVLAADVVGVWALEIETPGGDTLTPVLSITQTAGKLNGTYKSNENEIEAKELQIKDNHLHFKIDTQFQGGDLHVEFKGRPQGSKLNGTLEYSLNGDSGELEFSGGRKATKQ